MTAMTETTRFDDLRRDATRIRGHLADIGRNGDQLKRMLRENDEARRRSESLLAMVEKEIESVQPSRGM